MDLRKLDLADKYRADAGTVYVTGTQVLVRLPLAQRRRDAAAGLRTAGYVSGYRGSPLGGFDQQLGAASELLDSHDIRFQPGVNEDLAATACWGTQQAHLDGDNTYDGVFALWYGKGPGVDRSGDAFRHGNLAGTAPHGGVLVLMGDDHTCESSTTAHQSEFALVDAMMPILNPAGLQELHDYGLYGWALSRYSGCWVGLKCVKDTVDATGTIDADIGRPRIRLPDASDGPAGDVHIRLPDPALDQEARLHDVKIEAAKAFARANRLDRRVLDAEGASLGIATAGKSYLDVVQALRLLGVEGETDARRLGLRVLKIGMTWPLEPAGVRSFAQGLREVVVVEEKRGLVESQVKDILYGSPDAPRVFGKRGADGGSLFPSHGALDPNRIAIALGHWILRHVDDPAIRAALDACESRARRDPGTPALERTPYFCAGCPHNTGTRIPEGSRAMAGIGCHYMAQWMDRRTSGYTQMGGEGASWMGMAPFVKTRHVFQNMGDGTYFHSGALAIRAAIASGVTMTYKILFNDAVAMTGGQRLDGQLTVSRVAGQVLAEGARRVVVVSDEPEKYAGEGMLPAGVSVHSREAYLPVQESLARIDGVSVVIYDQTCAAEKRRRRKRGQFPDPPRRLFIHDLVCEGCGDCGVKSNCTAVVPLETFAGRKRRIDQSACNKDYSCVEGFCPSFVSIRGGGLRREAAAPSIVASSRRWIDLPDASPPLPARPYGIIVAGIGGTGVVTIGAIVGMAAHLEGKGFSCLDMAGLAQKGGAVWSHLQIAERSGDIAAARLSAGGADLVLGCDLVVAASERTLATTHAATRVVANAHEAMTGAFTRAPDLAFPGAALRDALHGAVGEECARFVDASRIATALAGDALASNMLLLGYAHQLGCVPVSAEAIEAAIELNGTAVAMNQAAFLWGRRLALDPAAVESCVDELRGPVEPSAAAMGLDEYVDRGQSVLAAYQHARWAARYRALVDEVRGAEARAVPGSTRLARAVARNALKLMAYKDEYEVARLYADPAFRRKLDQQFEGRFSVSVHLAPPLLARRDPVTGVPRKREFGPWIFRAFKLLAALRFLRGTPFDPFGRTSERRAERALIDDYTATIRGLLPRLRPGNLAKAVAIAALPDDIRGFGHIKQRSIDVARQRQAQLLRAFDDEGARPANERPRTIPVVAEAVRR